MSEKKILDACCGSRNWARHIYNECLDGEVSFFMKQVDKIMPIPEDLLIREFPNNNQ